MKLSLTSSRCRAGALRSRHARVSTRVAFPDRFAPFSLLPPVIPDNEPDLRQPRDGMGDAPQFPGFDAKDIPALAFMATLLRRNQVLNLSEGLLATLLLATTFGHANSFDVSERVLYIVCCLSNAVCLRVASRHFSQVRAQQADGLLTTVAGIQDLNILFSNVAFVAVLRAFVQVMEAGIQDPDLVVWLQGLGGVAVLVRLVVLQQLLAKKQQSGRPRGERADPDVNATQAMVAMMRDMLSAPNSARRRVCSALGPLLSPLYVQRAVQVYPKLFVSPKGELRGPAAVMHILRGASALASDPTAAHVASTDRQGQSADARGADSDADRVWDGGGGGSDERPSLTSMDRAVLRSAALTSIDKQSLPASQLSHSFVQSIGLSLDDDDVAKEPSEATPQPQPNKSEFRITGAFETVLKNNMEQLQWTSLSMTLLSLSTALLAVAQDFPAHIWASTESITVARDAAPNLMAFGVDMSEQIAMAIALSQARNSFRDVVDSQGRDISRLVDGVSEHHGLGNFLETWGIVQCGVIAAMLSQLLLAQDWFEVPAKEIVKVAGELIR